MKNIGLVIILIGLSFILSCNSDSSTDPTDNNNNGDVIATVTISTSGGTITADDLELNIPANSFTSSSTITVSEITESPFGSNRVSGSYQINGIPTNYSKAITIKLLHQNSVTSTGFVAVGAESFSKSLNSTNIAYTLFEARDSAGYLVIDLPVMRSNGNKFNQTLTQSNVSVIVEAINATESMSTYSHFKIVYPSIYASQAVSLAGYLEEAYTKYHNMGFVYNITEPINVSIVDLGTEYYGKYSYNLWSDWLEFNSQKISDLAEVRTTAGHEFFHWVQMRYDNRMWASKVLSSGERYWFEEASAVWAEEKFSSSSNYCSSARDGNEMSPFYGLQKGAATDPEGHGYGMSAFVKYLTLRYGEGIVKDIFDQLKIGLKPMDAVQNKTTDPSSYWCDDFFLNYALGNIYNDISTAQIISDAQTYEWTVTYPSDTLKIFDFISHDLSAKLFKVKLDNDLLTDEAVMNFSLTAPDYCTLYLLAYKGMEMAFLGGGENELSLPELKAVKGAGYHILAMVVNSNIVTPFTNSTNANLTVRVVQPMFDFFACKWASIYVKTYREMELNDGSRVWGMGQLSIHNVNSGSEVGTWNGNTFTANFTYPYPGSMSITVDPVTGEVVSFSGSTTPAENCSVALAGHNIPYTENSAFPSPPPDAVATMHNVKGMDVCGHLTTYHNLQDWYANYMNVVNFSCNSESFIQIMFYSELP